MTTPRTTEQWHETREWLAFEHGPITGGSIGRIDLALIAGDVAVAAYRRQLRTQIQAMRAAVPFAGSAFHHDQCQGIDNVLGLLGGDE